MTSQAARLLSAAAVALATAAPVPVRAQPPPSPVHLLDVPYVPQSVELCGGAAAAMVMRYWGATGVYAESFQELVDEEAGGIRGGDLVRALEARGWQAVSFAGDAPLVRRHLDERRPPIALIEDRPGRYHYVVVVGWHDGRVVLHDPARAPFRIMDEEGFVRAWSRSGFWTLLALPDRRASGSPRTVPDLETPDDAVMVGTGGVCGGMVAEGVRLAHTGEIDQADDLLRLASLRCPGDAAPWRELAGLYAVRKEWGPAATAARRAVERDRADAHAARILATSLFLEGDADGALDAWNLLGEPRIDLLDLRGLERTRFAVAAGTLGLPPQTTLTSAALRRGARRLSALPAVRGARVAYAPIESGQARIVAAVMERPLLPTSPAALAGTGLRAGIDREVRVEVASPTGGGELWYAAWRWWEARPRVAAGLAAPAPFGGVWRLEGSDERQTYEGGTGRIEERHRRLAVGIGDWASATLRWETDLALDEWEGERALTLTGGLEYGLAQDRVRVGVRGGRSAGARGTWLASTSVLWRSRVSHDGTVWMIEAGGDAVGQKAPLAQWPGAGTGQARSPLLRAHPLLHDGVIRDSVLGRSLAHTTGEWRHWTRPGRGMVRIAPAAFVDVARAWRAADLGDMRTHVDVGAGVRIAVPVTGVLRVDVARGLRDGRSAISVGWSPQ